MIAVFYSFKGGVGRSMAMANVADLLARRGLQVLMVDFDMEAPGIEQYFPVNQSKARNHPGLLDLLLCYKQTVSVAATDEGPSFKEIERFILPVYEQLPAAARLDLMPAGIREGAEQLAQYAQNLRTFDWQDFITNWGGDRFFEWLRRRITELYDVVLIDSRTGVTEMGGICAYQLADTILMFSGANLQSIQGTQNLVRNFALPGVQLLRQYRPLDVMVVPARIEHSDEEMLGRVRERFAAAFGDDTPRILRSVGLECWDLRIPYEPHYAFEERVITDPSRVLTEWPIADAFRRIVRCLALLADNGSALAQCREAEPGGSEVTAPMRYDPTRRLATFDAVFLYNRRDRRAVDALVQRLENDAGLRVWADWSTAPGVLWATQLEEALLHARCIVVAIGNGGVQGPLLEEVNFVLGAAATKSEIRLIIVLLPNTEDAETRMPRRLREAQAVDFRRGSYNENFLQLANGIRGVRAALAPERPVVDFGDPYVGLQPFTDQHALFFAGRDAALHELLLRVRISPFIALTGPAGSGKSSLVQAGLFPALRQEKETAWETLVLGIGNDPIAGAEALAEAINEKAAAAAIHAIETSVAETARVLLDALDQRGASTANARWLLFVDNLEELFAPGRDPKRITLFVQLLVALARATGGPLCVLASCRDDALSTLQTAHPALADLIRDNRVELTPMTLEDLRQAIEQPAQRAGYTFEPGLLNRLLSDFAPDTRSLALLQTMLVELHRHAREGVLTNEAYDRLGGLAGFLAQRAESLQASLTPEERQAAQWLVLRLVQTSMDGKGTRRRAKVSDFNSPDILPAMVASALGKLRDLGLIVMTTEGSEEAVELASETLLQAWPQLRDWMDEHSENLLVRGEIETTTQTTGAAPLPPAMLDRIAAKWVSGTLKGVLNGREIHYILLSARFHGLIDLFEAGEVPLVARSAARSRVFVAMPFGKKAVFKMPGSDQATGAEQEDQRLVVDFEAVYTELLKPAISAAGLQPFRADDEQAAGDILKDVFAELVTADFFLADISILNANVFYELGIRHTVGPRGVICLHAGWSDRPFNVAPQRTFKYDGQLFRAGLECGAPWRQQLLAEVLRLGETLRKAVVADRTTEGSPVYRNLPNLVPPDTSRIGTASFKHYQTQSEEWSQRVAIAGKEGRAEDILTLAGDVPSPYDRRKLLRQCGDALLALGRFAPAEKVFKELCEDLDETGSVDEFRAKCQLALLANCLGRAREAEQILSNLTRQMPGDPEAQGLLGRVYKDMWRTAWSGGLKLEERLALAWRNAALARRSLATYEIAVRRDLRSYYNGINVVTLAALLEHAARKNKRIPKPEVPDLEDLKTIVRLAATAKLEDEDETVWARATLGELRLVLGHPQEALDEYEQAVAAPSLTWFNIRSMFEQVQLFQLLGYQPEAVERVATLLQQRLGEFPHPSARFDKIAICSGQMIDAPDRKTPLFPAEKAETVRAEIARQLARWEIGAGDLAICGGACGADTLFAEECLRRGAKIRLLLAQEVGDFVRDSVQHAGSGWVQRFHALYENADVATQPDRLGKAPPDFSIYARNYLWIINTARIEAADSAKIHALLVWDKLPRGDGPGGTFDSDSRVRELGGHIEKVRWNPSFKDKLAKTGPRKLLALDAGGIRGVITLEVLAEIEKQLQAQFGRNDDFVLADFFDYIAGSGTGAIIGICLALGMRVGDVARWFYEECGPAMFDKAGLIERFKRGKFRDKKLAARLQELIRDKTGDPMSSLGSEHLRTLLMVVLRNTTTNSPWPVSNNPAAKYNALERPNCDLRIPLWHLVHVSTATQTFFPPEVVKVGEDEFIFADGGVTIYNNPAFQLFLMATIEAYNLGWVAGEKEMLLVSIGAGTDPKANANLAPGQMNLIYNASSIPSALMFAASNRQDFLCRIFGKCLIGDPLDWEVHNLIDERNLERGFPGNKGPCGKIFTYLRYNAELSAGGLHRLGVGHLKPEHVQQMDSVDHIADMQEVGVAVAKSVSIQHFGGFLASTSQIRQRDF